MFKLLSTYTIHICIIIQWCWLNCMCRYCTCESSTRVFWWWFRLVLDIPPCSTAQSVRLRPELRAAIISKLMINGIGLKAPIKPGAASHWPAPSVNDFQETQVPHLLQAGFKKEKISTTTMDIAPPSDCKYYSFNKMITPTIIKE